MKIRRLQLHNAFQHEDLDIKLTDFHAITGANGSGKSNVIESIRYILTNKFILPGTLDTMLREGEDKGYIKMDIEDEGDTLTTRVALGRTSRKLTGRDMKMGKSGEIVDYIVNVLLKATPDAVNQSTIVGQGALTDGLFDSQAKRTAVFMRLAGLSDIEKKRDMLRSAVSANIVPMSSFNKEDTEAKIQELQTKRDLLTQEIESFTASSCDESLVVVARKAVSDNDAAVRVLESLKTYRADYEVAKEVADETSLALTAAKIALDEVSTEFDKLMVGKDDAMYKVKVFNESQVAVARRTQLEASMLETAEKVDLLVANPIPDKADKFTADKDTLRDIVADAKALINLDNATLAAFSKDTRKCPTCRDEHTEESANEIINRATKSKEATSSGLQEATTAFSSLCIKETQWQQVKSKHDSDLAELKSKANTLVAEYDAIDSVTVTEDPVEAKALISNLADLSQKLKARKTTADNIEELYNEADKNRVVIESRVASLSGEETLVLSSEQLEGNKALITNYESSSSEIASRNGQLSGVSSQIEDEEFRLSEIIDKEAAAAKSIKMTHTLEYARTALHRDNFPAGKVKAFVDRMLLGANVYLDAMQAGFSVSYERDQGFIGYFPKTNKSMRADRLSGGQSIVFALAFRFAVNELHTDTGFLILDEPTVWLDDDHVDQLVNALALVKSKLTPRTQVIVVTHDERLAAVCDGVSEIPPA